jgi:hypothetical protein
VCGSWAWKAAREVEPQVLSFTVKYRKEEQEENIEREVTDRVEH